MYGGGPLLVREDPMDIYSKDLNADYLSGVNPKTRPGAVGLKLAKTASTNIF